MQNKITWQILWMTALAQAAISLYLPAFPAIAASLQIDPAAVKSTITIFFLSYGLSQLLYGPLSDRYGRKPLLLIGICLFCLGCVINIFAPSFAIFMLARFLQGFGSGSLITIGRAILRDCFSGNALASAASYNSMGFAIGLGTTPIIGAYLQSYISWRADFAFLLLAGLILFAVIWRWLPETASVPAVKKPIPQFVQLTLSEYKTIISNKLFLQFLFGGILAYSVVVAYNVMTPFLIQQVLGYPANIYGWLAILIAVPYYAAAVANRSLVLKYGNKIIIAIGIILMVLAGIIMLFCDLFAQTHLASIILPLMLATFGQALIFPNAIAGAIQNSAHPAGKASAMFSSLQLITISIFSAIMAILPDTNALSLAGVLICLGLLAGAVLGRFIYSKQVHT